ncbi:hypothetical protein NPIL_309731 [Nephila pilipes]|uniref:Uncharacterized protein n=1 Tax=Nephila pilipes TaxID=299642 RepID=A0A8X6QMR6_NEPPI|nr:hypothetical protein NPIL_309731 [Nephila pilipes]
MKKLNENQSDNKELKEELSNESKKWETEGTSNSKKPIHLFFAGKKKASVVQHPETRMILQRIVIIQLTSLLFAGRKVKRSIVLFLQRH